MLNYNTTGKKDQKQDNAEGQIGFHDAIKVHEGGAEEHPDTYVDHLIVRLLIYNIYINYG